MSKKNNNNQSHSGSTYGLEDFDHSLPISLLRAREAVMRKFIPILRSHDLSPEQWRVIRVLKLDGSLELAELSRRCFLLAASLSRIAQNLENREILVRTTVKDDQRRSLISLTEKGNALFAEVAPKSSEQYAAIKHLFGTENLESLYALLNKLVGSLEQR